jgi:aminoglycoside/choline kinase family phosphotransferase
MLLEDVGSATLFDWRDRPWESIEPWLRAAHRAALRLRDIDPAEVAVGLLPPLDAAALERELAMTWDVFLLPSGLVGDDALSRRLRSQLGALCAALQASGMVPCHRDLMARNLVPIEASGEVVLLDHQDLRLGPSTYDAASLFNDSLYPAEERVETMVGGAIYRSGAYHRAVAQRSLKIVGTFASFARRGQPRHLPLIPISLRRGLDHLAALPETTSLAADLERKWAKALC